MNRSIKCKSISLLRDKRVQISFEPISKDFRQNMIIHIVEKYRSKNFDLLRIVNLKNKDEKGLSLIRRE